jgi:hypothetical protein
MQLSSSWKRIPDLLEAGALAVLGLAAVEQGGRPVKLHVGVEELALPLLVSLLDRNEALEYHPHVLVATHRSPPFRHSRAEMTQTLGSCQFKST